MAIHHSLHRVHLFLHLDDLLCEPLRLFFCLPASRLGFFAFFRFQLYETSGLVESLTSGLCFLLVTVSLILNLSLCLGFDQFSAFGFAVCDRLQVTLDLLSPCFGFQSKVGFASGLGSRRFVLPLCLGDLFGEPLVCTPRDAVRSFYSSGIDAMFVGHFFLQK